ncbi:MAG: 16S rRNA (cytosine(1402)-N(4))-methyltransferase RsmH [Ardenticatenaceae bacterium]|nr:16S rRNA (cytosine(1402)-N(4))-methyltransferase RsmH [Ardenticatenaceae bacterium]MCB9442836.1 16S rRNA (cytosine(1402)-N(4))-methyltransferase RsmH [Ardenticatenaceae bacterium]
MTNDHIPVLYHEVLQLLRPQPDGRYLDATLGAGGHTAGILQASAPTGRVLAFDRDPEAIAFARKQLALYGDRVTYVNASYAEMVRLAPANGFAELDGILFDLGLSSRQLEQAERGFSFMKDGPLDMRFDPTQGETAADLINNLSETELAKIFWQYGEEQRSRRLAQAIVNGRPFTTTRQLADFVAAQVKGRERIHPATRIFQALRIATNHELEAVETGVQAAIALLKPGGRVAVISFHSLEDRFVKQLFRHLSQGCTCPPQQPVCTCGGTATLRLITRKAVKASEEEIQQNPRSRSARLRVAEKMTTGE